MPNRISDGMESHALRDGHQRQQTGERSISSQHARRLLREALEPLRVASIELRQTLDGDEERNIDRGDSHSA